MSRGLGSMQRLILDALVKRPGGDWACERDQNSEHVARYGGWYFKLADEFHDMRVVAYELADKYNWFSHCTFVRQEIQASFSRALRGLENRRLIDAPSIVPVVKDKSGRAIQCADGLFLFDGNKKQRRFVRLANFGISS